MCTIGFSLVFSLVLFTTILGACGPEGDTGSICPPLHSLWHKLRGRGNVAHDCHACHGKGYVLKASGHTQDNATLVDKDVEDASGREKRTATFEESVYL
jgi:hypothetical protein